MGIILNNISKRFGDKTVFTNFSASFTGGSRTCIVGRSGCGKTTLLRIILGLIPPDTGSVTCTDGERFSAVFQEDRLCEDFSAVTNVRIAVGRGLSRRTIEGDLVILGLEGSTRVPVRDLSGGMRRRVSIARAMLARSGCVVMDEAFKGLDDATRNIAVDYVKSRLGDRTLILVSHDPRDAADFGASVLRL